MKSTEEYQQAVLEIKQRIPARYEEKLKQAGFVRKWCLRWKIHKGIKKETARLAPPNALY